MAIRLALIGCGGMGRRHLRAYHELASRRPGLIELAAVVDVVEERAQFVANEAAELLGQRPRVFTSLDGALHGTPELQAIDLVAAASAHHTLAVRAMEAGLHVLTEKPMAATVRACKRMGETATRTQRVLSVAEGHRRDPIARLVRAALVAGVIGEPRMAIDISTGGGAWLSANPWRYLKNEGGPILESGVHNADLWQFYLGPVATLDGRVRLTEPERFFAKAPLKRFHEHYRHQYPSVIAATAPDAMLANLTFASGAWGHWLDDQGAHGPRLSQNSVFGSQGRLDIPSLRSGKPLTVWRDGSTEPLTDSELLAAVPEFHLDPTTAEFFGGERLARYQMTGVFGEADRKNVALEVAEFARAVRDGTPVEVGPAEGMVAVALVMAAHESSEAGQRIAYADVLAGRMSAYQDPVDRALGLLD
ncbi:MAG: Gfo/Idh/MocA family oxidoreductase [Actinobacteria bacterium]|nr:Gfo/Idh/MocA family oxidoreductase [Actinomycetota bacterium]